MLVYRNRVEYAEHIALVKGDIAEGGPVLVRMHALNVLDDVLGDHGSRSGTLHNAMRMIGEAGRGIVVLIREPRPTALRSEEHTSELQSLMRTPYAVFCLKKKTKQQKTN